MGSGIYISKHIGLLKKQSGSAREIYEALTKVNSKA
jgi:hypothetical protein